MNIPIKYIFKKCEEVSSSEKERMFLLMCQNYDHMDKQIFLNDFSNKDYVIVFEDGQGNIQGFSTFAVNPKGYQNKDYNILFSGDTIISGDFTGSQELVKSWCVLVASLLHKYPNKTWMWYLLSKGHRTYMYLPFFFEKYYPSVDQEHHADHFALADECSSFFFADSWRPSKGTLRFSEKMGQLKPFHTQRTYSKKSKHVDFFLEMNPHFDEGDELVCMAKLCPTNLKRLAKITVERSINSQSFFDV